MLLVDTQRRAGLRVTEGLADSLADELRTTAQLDNALRL
jgi:hypothetical protein